MLFPGYRFMKINSLQLSYKGFWNPQAIFSATTSFQFFKWMFLTRAFNKSEEQKIQFTGDSCFWTCVNKLSVGMLVSDVETEHSENLQKNKREISSTLYIVLRKPFWGAGRALNSFVKRRAMYSLSQSFFKASNLIWSNSCISEFLK